MTALEQAINLLNQGADESEIIAQLQEQGVSPREINDALNQLRIKSAVMGETGANDMQSSIMNEGAPAPGEEFQQETGEYPQQQAFYPQEEYQQSPTQEFYPQQYSSSAGTDTIMEVADQVISEKINPLISKIDKLNEFKNMMETKVEHINSRLKKVEDMIDKLQVLILQKVSSYGQNLEGIKKEMSMMQDSFGKMVNPISELANKPHISHATNTTATHKKHSKKK